MTECSKILSLGNSYNVTRLAVGLQNIDFFLTWLGNTFVCTVYCKYFRFIQVYMQVRTFGFIAKLMVPYVIKYEPILTSSAFLLSILFTYGQPGLSADGTSKGVTHSKKQRADGGSNKSYIQNKKH